MPGLHDLARAGARVDRHLDRARAVGGGYARGDAVTRLDRDREGGLERGLVLGGHQVEPQLLTALGRERQADQPAALFGHEVDRLRSGELGGKREVALVLAIFVVNDDDHAPLANVFERLLDGRKRGSHRLAHVVTSLLESAAPTSLATCLASTSTSMLTRSPTPAEPRFVRLRVSGIKRI